MVLGNIGMVSLMVSNTAIQTQPFKHSHSNAAIQTQPFKRSHSNAAIQTQLFKRSHSNATIQTQLFKRSHSNTALSITENINSTKICGSVKNNGVLNYKEKPNVISDQ